MTTILRLQGLDKNAGPEDIREWFKTLHIPDGGVYIVGGSLREAFIAFTTGRDAQLARRCSGEVLKGSKVTLHPSSMEELEHKLKLKLKKKKISASHLTEKSPQSSDATLQRLKEGPQSSDATLQRLKEGPQSSDATLQRLKEGPHSPNAPNMPPTTASPHDPRTANHVQPLDDKTRYRHPAEALDAFFLGMCTVIQSLQTPQQGESSADVSNGGRTPEQTPGSQPGYVRLFGLPASATKENICHFFRGLTVKEAIVNVKLGLGRGCLVKFASEQEAREALLYNLKSLDDSCVDVRGATEKMWTVARQECENTSDVGERGKLEKGPLKESANHKDRSTTLQTKRRPDSLLPCKSLKKARLEGDRTASPPPTEYTVMVRNLPKTLTKTDIKALFECPNISHKNVLHLLDKEGNRTDTAFLIFDRTEDYNKALNLTGCHVGPNAIEVSSVTKMTMKNMMRKIRPRIRELDSKKKPHLKRMAPVNPDPALQTCLFVRNMPADVRKSQIERLFSNYRLDKENIILLFDRNGNGIGEAVVQFKSQRLTALAQSLQGQDFLGSELFLTPITVKQMEEIVSAIV